MTLGITFKREKLVGRSNYIKWLTNTTLFLEINSFMPYIDSSELEPNKDLYYNSKEKKAYSPELAIKYIDKQSEYQRNNSRALGAIKSIISIDNTERFKDKKTAKELFKAIKSTFGKSSLELIGYYLDYILEDDYNSYKSINKYTSQIQSLAIYLDQLEYKVPILFLAWLLFKGLPSSFNSFNSCKYKELAADLSKINISKLITNLILEEARMNTSQSLEANWAARTNKDSFYSHYKKKGYLESRCYKKYPELKPNKGSNSKSNKDKDKEDSNPDTNSTKSESTKVIMSILANNTEDSSSTSYLSNDFRNKLVLDTGATKYYTPNKD